MSRIKDRRRNQIASRPREEHLPRRVAVMRALPGLGDWLCVVPALRALRAALPAAHIALIGLPQTRPLVERFPAYVDDLIPFPGFPGIEESTPDIQTLPDFFADMQGRFDLALQMHGSGVYSTPFTILLGARRTAGFYLLGQYCPDKRRFLPYPVHESEVWRNLRLMEYLGIPTKGDELEFPLMDEDWRMLYAIRQVEAIRRDEYICLHAGASRPERCWSPQRFAAVADALAARGLQIVLTGTAAETGRTQAVARAMNHKAIDLSGRTSLGALAALLSQARLLICNDTGVSHLAAALRVPSVVIFLASDVKRWAPLDRERHRVVGGFADVSDAQVDETAVLTQANSLLQGERVRVA